MLRRSCHSEACPGRGLAGQSKRSAPSSGGAGLPARQIYDACRTSVSRQCDRVAKVMDLKSIGLCPQGFKSPRCRRSSPCLRRALLVRRHRGRAARDLSRPWHKQARHRAGANLVWCHKCHKGHKFRRHHKCRF